MDEIGIKRSLMRISHEIIERNDGTDNVVIFGIKNRGIIPAKIICENLKKLEAKDVLFGMLDVTEKRDDYTEEQKNLLKSDSFIPCNIENKTVIIVDDVLYTGRTVRAAIETLFAISRPKSVQLAVIVDRGHREIPVFPLYVGKNIPTSRHERISVVMDNGKENGVYILSE